MPSAKVAGPIDNEWNDRSNVARSPVRTRLPWTMQRKAVVSWTRLQVLGAKAVHELKVYRRLIAHERTPRLARWCMMLALGYLAFPMDVIPDWIPVFGHLDDVAIVGGLLWIAVRMIPADLLAACRLAEEHQHQGWLDICVPSRNDKNR